MALVTLRAYRDPIDAELAKTRLEGAGIPAVVADQHLVGMNWLYSVAIGGVKLKVDESDLARARDALREDRSADLRAIPDTESEPAQSEPAEESPEITLAAEEQVHEGRSYPRVMFAIGVAIGVLYYLYVRIHAAGAG
jgi:putative signal transducing protein